MFLAPGTNVQNCRTLLPSLGSGCRRVFKFDHLLNSDEPGHTRKEGNNRKVDDAGAELPFLFLFTQIANFGHLLVNFGISTAFFPAGKSPKKKGKGEKGEKGSKGEKKSAPPPAPAGSCPQTLYPKPSLALSHTHALSLTHTHPLSLTLTHRLLGLDPTSQTPSPKS